MKTIIRLGQFWICLAIPAKHRSPGFAARLLPLLLLLAVPAVAQAQFILATNNGTIAITLYNGSGGNVTIPGATNGLPVTSIGENAFFLCTNLTRVSIPDSITNCGSFAFYYCSGLASVTIGDGITSVGNYAFFNCTNLTSVYFKGDAPSLGVSVFSNDNATVYYLPGTTNWSSSFGGLQTVLWDPQVQADANFGARSNRFGFAIAGTSNFVVVVDACTNLSNSAWSPLATNTLTGGSSHFSSYFSDPQWTNRPARFYRIRPPW